MRKCFPDGIWLPSNNQYLNRETPKDTFYLNAQGEVPLKSEFKPVVKVLSRKPIPKSSGAASVPGFEHLTVEDDEDEDEIEARKNMMSLEERQQKAQKVREEKQRKYEEARQRLFGPETTSVNQSTAAINLSGVQSNGESPNQVKDKGGRLNRPTSTARNKPRQLYDPNGKLKSNDAFDQKPELRSLGHSIPSDQQPTKSRQ